MKIPLSAPDITDAEIDAVTQVLRSGRLSLGPQLEAFESAVAQYAHAKRAVAISSGTAGLHLAVRALGLKEGDEVILPSFTFIAAANALLYERIAPVFVDIDAATLNLDPSQVESAITPRTRAILAVHTFGVPAALDELQSIAQRHNLFLIEDACEALGAEFLGKKVGSLADAGVFAFYPNKQITTAEGGVLATQNESLAARVRSLRNHGRSESADWLRHAELGFNYRLSELHAALGVAQMQRIDSILARREKIAHAYAERLFGTDALILPPLDLPNRRISWFVYVVRLAEGHAPAHRDRIIEGLAARGIAAARYFAPIHFQPHYREAKRAPLPITESIGARTIALPFFNQITNSQLDEVAETLLSLLGNLPGPGL
ncbi:MAG TPA: DegT/DnrJ/EryC1/StrS family aminotransferase [Candidatus Acidoferrum sp.]|nr:DegT/DnrJ/EryC1/StrS family aminotransferase [Candidatus Acidoferrum sp.]